MHPVRKKRVQLLLLLALVLAAVFSLVGYALRQNISLFYTPTQIQQGEAPKGKRIRVGGMVQKGSLQRQKGQLGLCFVIRDLQQALRVCYEGILPDLFREGQAVVVNGYLEQNGSFRAQEVLAKHDENYMPPEVRDALSPAKGKVLRKEST